MNLTVHMIEAKPSQGDPLAQRAYAALVWGPENELIEFEGHLDLTEAAAHVALTVAIGVMTRINPSLSGRAGGQAMFDRLSKAMSESPEGAVDG